MASIYKESMDLQARLDKLSSEDADCTLIVQRNLQDINTRWDATASRIARAGSAYFLVDGLTTGPFADTAQQFGEVIVKGHVPRVSYFEALGRLVVSLPFFEGVILGPSQEIEPVLVEYEMEGSDIVLPLDVPIRRPLHVPVESLASIMLAA